MKSAGIRNAGFHGNNRIAHQLREGKTSLEGDSIVFASAVG